MNEYYDYDEALKVNQERKRKAAALKTQKTGTDTSDKKKYIMCGYSCSIDTDSYSVFKTHSSGYKQTE